MTHSQNSDWAKAQETLKESMQREISMMRDILSNILQEENALLGVDKSSWDYLMQIRFQLVEKVKLVRKDRMEATQKLIDLSGKQALQKILDGNEESCEISFLLDQLIALSEKINHQNSRNQWLLENSEHFIAISKSLNYPSHLYRVPTVKGKKSFLTTIP
jgi:hypothetical protein